MREEAMAQPNQGNPARPGLPAPGSVVSEAVLRPIRSAASALAAGPAASIRTYRILRTNEVDPKDRPVARAQVPAIGAPAAPAGDDFDGSARKAAKLAIASPAAQSFADLPDLIKTLPERKAMINHEPEITTEEDSGRVVEEDRNVRLRAFLYAASREADNDYHLIVGRDPNSTPHLYMTAEISGLPPAGSAAFARLSAARAAYKAFFADQLPGTTYDFYDPPIPIEIEGSLFFDMSHAHGQGPGPKSLHKDIPTIWEIHPVSNIVFEP
jgi:hypothetical protein